MKSTLVLSSLLLVGFAWAQSLPVQLLPVSDAPSASGIEMPASFTVHSVSADMVHQSAVVVYSKAGGEKVTVTAPWSLITPRKDSNFVNLVLETSEFSEGSCDFANTQRVFLKLTVGTDGDVRGDFLLSVQNLFTTDACHLPVREEFFFYRPEA